LYVRTGDDVSDEQLRMSGYYIHFTPTGERTADMVLSAVACAGKAYHHTEDWNETADWPPHLGASPAAWIQNAAHAVASELKALRATCATLSEEKAQEVERRLRAEAERDEAKSAAVESYDMFQRERVRAERAEADRDNALALKRAAYDVLDGCRTVVEKTIIPALEYIGGGGGRPGVDLKREALAAAWKLLEDWAMDAPTDLYELLAALAPKGWRESFGPEFGLYLPPEKGGPKWIRQDGPGRVVMYGSGMLALGPSLLVPMELGAVVPFLRERGAM
jgi:hypothetical protein